MAKIKITSACELYDGMAITFKAPCDSSAVDGVKVYAANTVQSFSFRDAHGNDLSSFSDLFVEGVHLRAVLNTTDGYAFLQNIDTNGYLENRLLAKADLDEDGKIPAALLPITAYNLPIAGADTLGGVKIGSGLSVDDSGVLSLALSDGDGVSY